MKCPKCGYNSFEFHDICTKCSNDLNGYKATYGLKPIVLPQHARSTMAAAFSAEMPVDQAPEAVETESDMFTFDLPGDNAVAGDSTATFDDPFSFIKEPAEEPAGLSEFSFDGEPAAFQAKAPVNPVDDEFSSLLETSSLGEEELFEFTSTEPAPPATVAGSPGEFDLNSFSWDESPPATGGDTKPADDFDSFFGDSEETKK